MASEAQSHAQHAAQTHEGKEYICATTCSAVPATILQASPLLTASAMMSPPLVMTTTSKLGHRTSHSHLGVRSSIQAQILQLSPHDGVQALAVQPIFRQAAAQLWQGFLRHPQ